MTEADLDPQNKIQYSYHLINLNISMKSFYVSKRSKAILGICFVAICIGAITKKVISYPTGGCKKGIQKLNLNKEIKPPFVEAIRKIK